MMPFKPMLCKAGTPEDLDRTGTFVGWSAEPKFDGMRIIAEKVKVGGCWEVHLWSRRGKDVAKRFPEVAGAMMAIPFDCVLDGELIIYKGTPGRGSDFEKVVKRANTNDPGLWARYSATNPATLMAFDCLRAGGIDHLWKPLSARRNILEDVLSHMREPLTVQRCAVYFGIDFAPGGNGLWFFLAHGYEGMVLKRNDSCYQAGARSGDWVKFKAVDTVDVEVIGCTKSDAGLPFGALIMVKDGQYYGKVGTGFTEGMRRNVHNELRESTMFISPVQLPREVANEILFLCEPKSAEIKIMGEMSTGSPRHPVFYRWRAEQG